MLTQNEGAPGLIRRHSAAALKVMALLLVTLQLGRLLYGVHVYSVDVPFWDQWDFYNALFSSHSLWEVFTWQHGPHRQGAGFLLMWAVNVLTDWNQRAQAFLVVGIMMLAAAAYLWLKQRLFGKLKWYDSIPVLMILSLKSWEIYVATPNVSHGALPLLLVVLIAGAWSIRNSVARYASVVLLNFLALFTGFGFFAGLVTPAVLVVDTWRSFREKRTGQSGAALLAVLLSVGSLWLFFRNYTLQPAVDCFQFPDKQWYFYPVYMAVETSAVVLPGNVVSIPGVLIGLASVGAFTTIALLSFWGLRNTRGIAYERHQAIFFLIAYALLFSANSAVGRLCIGLATAASSRYVPLMLPAIIGSYLFLMNHPRWLRGRYVLPFLFLATIVTAVPTLPTNMARSFRNGKLAWVKAYRETGNPDLADQQAGFAIHPNNAATKLAAKLTWLRERRFSLFRAD